MKNTYPNTNKLLLFAVMIITTYISCSSRLNSSKNTTQNDPEVSLGWKLGAQAYTFNRFSFTQALSKIDSCGLHFVEAYPSQIIGGGIQEKMDFRMSETSKTYLQKLLKAKGIRLVSYGVITTKDSNDWEKIFAFAKSMGVENITCEPQDKDIPLVSKLCDKYQINAAIHNHPNPSIYWKPDVVLNTIKGQSKRLGACADIGHWVRSGLDPIAALKQLEGHVIQLHFKDLNEFGNVKAHDVHWGTGVSNVKGVIAELKRQQFKGVISAEYEYNWENNVPDVTASVINFRKIVQEK
ncbi:sugar phosphate isomerase/epimerase [Pedobacter hiemivivus]|uniref:Sugar phosphate isomerase/epimerase n=1 Tax=Pedobacter hiemivivus TaxID=2530454 RepID=A0A4U1FY00_9SPHI|nr:TIM barrel protein [Pedobacter hiemivivus]TKC55564.1 sugar phosphate isomerase/epimerase [Pedobacter hiemivivus]